MNQAQSTEAVKNLAVSGPSTPLAGMRVVEIGHVAAGPFATMLLADLGADVVKVEPPSGDQMRKWPPIDTDSNGNDFSHNFASVNRNKRSVALDLKTDIGRAAARDLILHADVVVENYRPGALTRFGLDFASVTGPQRDGRGLIYCSISGFGQTGPMARRPAYDVVIQGFGGVMSVTGEPGRPPAKCGVPVADFVSGLYAAYTITAQYPETRGSGRVVHLDCSMLDCLLGISALQTSEFWGSGVEPTALGSRHPRNAPYQAFRAADRPFVIAAGNDRLWAEVSEVVGMPQLRDDPRFADQVARSRNQVELAAILGVVFSSRDADYWLSVFEQQGVPCGPINTYKQVLDSDQVIATKLIEHVDCGPAGTMPMISYPVSVDGHRIRAQSGFPGLGADLESVMAEWLPGTHA